MTRWFAWGVGLALVGLVIYALYKAWCDGKMIRERNVQVTGETKASLEQAFVQGIAQSGALDGDSTVSIAWGADGTLG